MIDVTRKKRIREYDLFRLVLLMYFVPKYLEFTSFVKIDVVNKLFFIIKNISYFAAIVLSIYKLCIGQKVGRKYLCLLLLFVLYFLFQALFNDANNIFVVFLFSFCFDDRYLDNYFNDIFIVSSILFITTIFSCKLGIIENVVTSRNKFGSVWIAESYGFVYSGQMIMMLIPIVMMYFYNNRGKITWKDNSFWFFVTIYVYMKCKTIMGMVLIITFICAYIFISSNRRVSKKILLNSKCICAIPYIFCAMSVFFVILYRYGSAFGYWLDVVVNGRLSVSNRVIDSYGITLLGTGFVNNTMNGKYEILDSEYIFMLVSNGVIYLVISLFLCHMLVNYARKKRDSVLVLIWVMILFNAIFNNGIFGIVMNPFSILIVPSIRVFFENNQVILFPKIGL